MVKLCVGKPWLFCGYHCLTATTMCFCSETVVNFCNQPFKN